jgi:hypothetical protein
LLKWQSLPQADSMSCFTKDVEHVGKLQVWESDWMLGWVVVTLQNAVVDCCVVWL